MFHRHSVPGRLEHLRIDRDECENRLRFDPSVAAWCRVRNARRSLVLSDDTCAQRRRVIIRTVSVMSLSRSSHSARVLSSSTALCVWRSAPDGDERQNRLSVVHTVQLPYVEACFQSLSARAWISVPAETSARTCLVRVPGSSRFSVKDVLPSVGPGVDICASGDELQGSSRCVPARLPYARV